jgi:recombination protein RecT
MARQKDGATAVAQPPAEARTEIEVAKPRPQGQPAALKAMLDSHIDKIAKAMPEGVDPKRLVEVVSAMNYRNPDLQKCDPKSILAATLQGAALGLDFSTTMGEAYLIPRWNNHAGLMECQFQPGYRGLIKLCRNSGYVVKIVAEVVRERDTFVYEYTPDLHFRHVPYLGADRGDVTHAYAYAKTVHGEELIAVMTHAEVEDIHQRSDNYRSAKRKGKPEFGPWVSDWPEMAKKTVLKRLSKMLPMSAEVAKAIEADNVEYAEVVQGNVRLAAQPVRGVAALKHQLGLEEKPLPPQPSVVYSEAETEVIAADSEDDPNAYDPDGAAEAGDAWAEGRE